MWEDAKPSSHPVVVKNITGVLEILSYLDAITYYKGSSILRMLEKIVGADQFRTSLQNYLKSYAFNVGNLNMFYNDLFTNINGTGTEFIKTWLDEINYP